MRMSLRRLAPVLLACSALALAPAAMAQSAGDDQYVDPLNGVTDGGGSSESGSGSSDGASGATSGGSVDAPAATGSGELPAQLARTGVELPLTAGAGLLLLAGGIGLRRLSGARD